MAQSLIANSIAPSTTNNYLSACNRYENFCCIHNSVPYPPCQQTLILYVTQLSTYSSYSNIKLHLSAIRHFTIRQNMQCNIHTFQQLFLLIKGIKRTQGKRFKKHKRAPITPAILIQIHEHLFRSEHVYEDKLMLWSALLTAFYGFLRVYLSTQPHTEQNLTQNLHYWFMTSH